MALALGIALPLVETWRRFDGLADWPSWLDDYIASALLLYGWYAGRGEVPRARPYLMAAWGYTLGMAYMSFFGQLSKGATTDPSGFSVAVVTGIKGFGVSLSAVCLALTWRGD